MTHLRALTLTAFVIALVATCSGAASAAPFLVCDAPPATEGVTHYDVQLGTAAPTRVPAPLKYDLAAVPSGMHTVTVRAVRVDALWGDLRSDPAPFEFSRPAAPARSAGVRLSAN